MSALQLIHVIYILFGIMDDNIVELGRFYFLHRSYADNQEDAVKQCQVLLDEVDLENAVRVGDVYAFLIEHYASKQRWKAVSFE